MNVKFPAFDETDVFEEQINKTSHVVKIYNVEEDCFNKYCTLLEDNGYKKEESRHVAYDDERSHNYAAFSLDGYGIFLNYFSKIKELTIVTEENCNYFSYTDTSMPNVVAPQITQVHLADFGMSYAIRLGDGRFIVIDGGWNFTQDAQNLMEVLQKGSGGKTPVVAAWIMTHAHCDHYRCFNRFAELFGDDVIVEKVLFDFPDAESYPKEKYLRRELDIKDENYNVESNHSDFIHINLMYSNIEKLGAQIFMPHIGQIYKIGDAIVQFLSGIEDTADAKNEDSNAQSLVFRIELGTQVILFTADASFSAAQLSGRYGEFLKSDILQVPHHGFGSGGVDAQKEGYAFIKPSVCLLPVSEENAFTRFDTYVEGSRHLFLNQGIDELITGDVTTTITLPYTAPAYKKHEIKERYLKGRQNAGSTAWIFTGLNTANKDDFVFSLLNLTRFPVDVYIDIIFEEPSNYIENIRAQVNSSCFRNVNIIDESDVEKNPKYFNWHSLNVKDIPENSEFAVRFICDKPIVVSHKNHTAAHKSDFIE